jgi:zinc protease
MSFSAHRGADPDAVFYDTIAVTTAQHHKRAIRSGAPFIGAVTLPKALAFWNARMANAAGFTLVMSGDFTLDRVRPLVTRFLASLPAGVREVPRDRGMRAPTGVVHREILVGVGPRARTQITLSGPFDYTSESSEALSAARDVAELALENQLRETLGGTYGVSVAVGVNLVPPIHYTVTIDFEAAPERINVLAAAALTELQRLSSKGPTALELEKTRAAEIHDLDNRIQDNAYWATELSWHARMGWPLASITAHQPNAQHLTLAALREACAKYLGTSQYTRVTMYPKTAVSH